MQVLAYLVRFNNGITGDAALRRQASRALAGPHQTPVGTEQCQLLSTYRLWDWPIKLAFAQAYLHIW